LLNREVVTERVESVGDESVPEHCACDVLVVGCGNDLFGDDGFGPAVARRLLSGWNTYSGPVEPPPGACVLDVGTAVRTVLFDVLLGPVRPRRVVVVDAVDMGRSPGEVWCIEAGDLPEVKLDDFSMHQVPTSNMLRELSELAGVEVTCVVGQVSEFPREVRPGLSAPVEQAVDRAVEIVLQYCGGPLPGRVFAGRAAAEPRGT
jgi:coenzyme F420 hydrogenase subunit delta